MKIQIESTRQINYVDGVPARVWEGTTDTGIKVMCMIVRVAVHMKESPEAIKEFQQQLEECKAPSAEVSAFPLRMIL